MQTQRQPQKRHKITMKHENSEILSKELRKDSIRYRFDKTDNFINKLKEERQKSMLNLNMDTFHQDRVSKEDPEDKFYGELMNESVETSRPKKKITNKSRDEKISDNSKKKDKDSSVITDYSSYKKILQADLSEKAVSLKGADKILENRMNRMKIRDMIMFGNYNIAEADVEDQAKSTAQKDKKDIERLNQLKFFTDQLEERGLEMDKSMFEINPFNQTKTKHKQFEFVKNAEKNNIALKFDKRALQGLKQMQLKGHSIKDIQDTEVETEIDQKIKKENPLDRSLELQHYRDTIDNIYEKFYREGKWAQGLKKMITRPKIKTGRFTALFQDKQNTRNFENEKQDEKIADDEIDQQSVDHLWGVMNNYNDNLEKRKISVLSRGSRAVIEEKGLKVDSVDGVSIEGDSQLEEIFDKSSLKIENDDINNIIDQFNSGRSLRRCHSFRIEGQAKGHHRHKASSCQTGDLKDQEKFGILIKNSNSKFTKESTNIPGDNVQAEQTAKKLNKKSFSLNVGNFNNTKKFVINSQKNLVASARAEPNTDDNDRNPEQSIITTTKTQKVCKGVSMNSSAKLENSKKIKNSSFSPEKGSMGKTDKKSPIKKSTIKKSPFKATTQNFFQSEEIVKQDIPAENRSKPKKASTTIGTTTTKYTNLPIKKIGAIRNLLNQNETVKQKYNDLKAANDALVAKLDAKKQGNNLQISIPVDGSEQEKTANESLLNSKSQILSKKIAERVVLSSRYIDEEQDICNDSRYDHLTEKEKNKQVIEGRWTKILNSNDPCEKIDDYFTDKQIFKSIHKNIITKPIIKRIVEIYDKKKQDIQDLILEAKLLPSFPANKKFGENYFNRNNSADIDDAAYMKNSIFLTEKEPTHKRADTQGYNLRMVNEDWEIEEKNRIIQDQLNKAYKSYMEYHDQMSTKQSGLGLDNKFVLKKVFTTNLKKGKEWYQESLKQNAYIDKDVDFNNVQQEILQEEENFIKKHLQYRNLKDMGQTDYTTSFYQTKAYKDRMYKKILDQRAQERYMEDNQNEILKEAERKQNIEYIRGNVRRQLEKRENLKDVDNDSKYLITPRSDFTRFVEQTGNTTKIRFEDECSTKANLSKDNSTSYRPSRNILKKSKYSQENIKTGEGENLKFSPIPNNQESKIWIDGLDNSNMQTTINAEEEQQTKQSNNVLNIETCPTSTPNLQIKTDRKFLGFTIPMVLNPLSPARQDKMPQYEMDQAETMQIDQLRHEKEKDIPFMNTGTGYNSKGLSFEIGRKIKEHVLAEAVLKKGQHGSFNKRERDRQKIGKIQSMLFKNEKLMRKMKNPQQNTKALNTAIFQLDCVDTLDKLQKDCNGLKFEQIESREKMDTRVTGLVEKIERLNVKAKNYQTNMEADMDENILERARKAKEFM